MIAASVEFEPAKRAGLMKKRCQIAIATAAETTSAKMSWSRAIHVSPPKGARVKPGMSAAPNA